MYGKTVFVKIVTDPDVDLQSVVGLAVAQAIDDGHDVSVFFAANGVKMLQKSYQNVRGYSTNA